MRSNSNLVSSQAKSPIAIYNVSVHIWQKVKTNQQWHWKTTSIRKISSTKALKNSLCWRSHCILHCAHIVPAAVCKLCWVEGGRKWLAFRRKPKRHLWSCTWKGTSGAAAGFLCNKVSSATYNPKLLDDSERKSSPGRVCEHYKAKPKSTKKVDLLPCFRRHQSGSKLSGAWITTIQFTWALQFTVH